MKTLTPDTHAHTSLTLLDTRAHTHKHTQAGPYTRKHRPYLTHTKTHTHTRTLMLLTAVEEERRRFEVLDDERDRVAGVLEHLHGGVVPGRLDVLPVHLQEGDT